MKAKIGIGTIANLKRENVEIRDTALAGFIVRCRASGKHTYFVELGRGRRLTLGRTNKLQPGEARKLAQDAIHDQANGRDPIAERRKRDAPTLDLYLNDTYGPWVAENLQHGEATIERIRTAFPDLLKIPITDISTFSLERWRTQRLKAGTQPATVNRDMACLRGALSRAVEWKHITAHPMAGVKACKIDARPIVRFLSVEEEKRLRDALQARDDERRRGRASANVWRDERGYGELPTFGRYTDHLTPLVLTAMNTGCRRGELLALRWQDVDLTAGRLYVRGTTSKTGQTRKVPLNTEARDVLGRWKPEDAAPEAPVFAGHDGKQIAWLKTAWGGVLKRAKIKAFRFHDLRHHFASRLVQHDVDLTRVGALLGHSDTKMTLRYAHLRDEDLADAVQKIC